MIEVLINIDGLPLSKSSSSQIYPILCSLYSNPTEVTVVGIYHGYENPANANEFLIQFVNEAIDFTLNGISISLRENIEKDRYINFLCLHIAVTIFSNEKYIQKYADYAHLLLTYFVQNFGKLYGKENISHNVHGLIHVYDDIQIFGNFSRYSAFPFENFLQSLKNLPRKHEKPLQQIVKRIKELDRTFYSKEQVNQENFSYKQEHFEGPVPNQNIQFKKLILEKILFNIGSLSDSFCYLTNGNIMKIENILVKKDIYVYGRIFLESNNLFPHPCDSSILNIYIAKNLGEYSIRSVQDIQNKMIAFIQEEGFIFFPLLH
ncbi:hypothetical protein ALC57_18695 [Trachymyrmex cornetzi]|uniref:Uncharacterized protein n=1 Tax=Trachymyrmex cornetzi TaxID=471704 RepID=A0A151IRE8_9HYME|nr:hypothetical protein ALC57_18695 [Trachymyrmex cornetzi]